MIQIEKYSPADRAAVEQIYRRVFGPDAADANRLRWDWQYLRNPDNGGGKPAIWVAKKDGMVVAQYATMPVTLHVKDRDVSASWGTDVMVTPERQREGIGCLLYRTWDQAVGASLGLGLSEPSYQLFRKLRWPDVGPVPCLVKPLSRRALRRANWPMPLNRLISALTLPIVKLVGRVLPAEGRLVPIRRFGPGFTTLWESMQSKLDFAVRRDAPYLNWKYAEPPHVRYNIVALMPPESRAAGSGQPFDVPRGYAVFRHAVEPRGRVTLLVDFLVDPDDVDGFRALARHVDEAARQADSDKIRVFALHAGFRRLLKKCGYFQVKSTMEMVAKVNAAPVDGSFYEHTDRWHVTLGDSDQDR